MKLLTTPQASELLGLPEATLRSWRHRGFGPGWAKLGRRVVYRESDVHEWIEAQFKAAKVS